MGWAYWLLSALVSQGSVAGAASWCLTPQSAFPCRLETGGAVGLFPSEAAGENPSVASLLRLGSAHTPVLLGPRLHLPSLGALPGACLGSNTLLL